MQHLTTLLLALVLAAGAAAQTLNQQYDGANIGDRCGWVLGSGIDVNGGSQTCSENERRMTGAPAWSSWRGRVELWYWVGGFNPVWGVSQSFIGDAAGDRFGWAICTDGDLNGTARDFVVGAPGANGYAGYVRAISSGTCSIPSASVMWTYNGTSAGDQVGFAVATMDDVNGDGHDDVIVGAPFRDSPSLFGGPTPDAGSAYVLSGIDGSFIRWHNGGTQNGFLGWAIEVIEDVDGDGKRDYLIGEPGYDVWNGTTTLNQAGRVRAYSGATGASISSLWMYGQKANAQFGRAIAAIGDADQDGVHDIAVGSPLYDQGSFIAILDVGRVEVFSGATGSVIFAMNGPPNSKFGTAIAGGYDLLGDGYPEIVVGGPNYDSQRGVARVISTRTQSTVYEVTGSLGEELGAAVEMTYDEWSVGTPGRFSDRGGWRDYAGQVDWDVEGPFAAWGSSIAVLDDVDGDGWDDFAASQYTPGGNYVAPVLEIRSGRTSGVIFPISQSALYGHTVACVGDVDGDGVRDIAHGKPYEGIVVIRSGDSPGSILRTVNSSVAPGALFGHSMADAGDIDGDGVSDFMVGEPGYDGGSGVNAGRLMIYSGASGAHIRTHVGSDSSGQLGYCVVGLGDVDGDGTDDYGAGAPFASVFVTPLAGRAFVWSGVDGSLIWQGNGAHTLSRFGRSMCGPGDVNGDGLADFAVGEPYWGVTTSDDHGRMLVYEGGAAGSGHPVLHTAVGAHGTANAGYSVAAVGDVDRDGIGDLAYASPRLTSTSSASVDVISGATGDVLFTRSNSFGNFEYFGHLIAGRPGAHADGRQELLIGAPSTVDAGTVHMEFLPDARAESLGAGCGGAGSAQPTLALSPPKLGQLATLQLQDVPATASPPQLFVSFPVVAPLQLGWGCEVWLDLPSTSLLGVLPGNILLTSFVAEDVTLAGTKVHLQVAAFDNNAPLSLVLTNGVALQFGF